MLTSETGRYTPGQYQYERLIRTILDLAEDHGFDRLDAQAIARAAGMSAEELVDVFPDDSSVQRALLGWAYDKLMTLLEYAEACGDDPLTALERIFLANISFVTRHPAIPELLATLIQTEDVELKAQVQDMIRGYEADLATLVCVARAEGLIRWDVDPQTAAAYFITVLQGLVFRMLMHGEKRALRGEAEEMFRLYLDGIRVPAQQTQPGQETRNADGVLPSPILWGSASRPRGWNGLGDG